MKFTEAIEKYEKIKKSNWEDGNYVLINKDDFILFEKNNKIVDFKINKCFLIDDTWEEYIEDLKTNFKREKTYYTIELDGEVREYRNCNLNSRADTINHKNFNYFPNKKLAEFINKKQLLERQLMVFSYLNGADKISWNNINMKKYYIDPYINNYFYVNEEDCYACKGFNNIYFLTEEVRDKAIELYKKDIEEVLNMSFSLGF
ncbi:hypothetical protein KLN56_10805 [Clostridioides difficile]|nr:hypothetical protein [Clostridioides difficile]MDO0345051.1 hypothetical protein [Clostridioides difficile]